MPSGRSGAAVLLTIRNRSYGVSACAASAPSTSAPLPARMMDGRRLQGPNDRGVALAAATAQRGRAKLATTAAQLVDERDHQPGA